MMEQQSDGTAGASRSSFVSEDTTSILPSTRVSPLGGESISMASSDPQSFAERWIQQQQQDQALAEITILEQDYTPRRPSLWSNSDLTIGSSVELSEDDVNDRFEQQFGDLFDPEEQDESGDPEQQHLLTAQDPTSNGSTAHNYYGAAPTQSNKKNSSTIENGRSHDDDDETI